MSEFQYRVQCDPKANRSAEEEEQTLSFYSLSSSSWEKLMNLSSAD